MAGTKAQAAVVAAAAAVAAVHRNKGPGINAEVQLCQVGAGCMLPELVKDIGPADCLTNNANQCSKASRQLNKPVEL
jgi:hypothetical protein